MLRTGALPAMGMAWSSPPPQVGAFGRAAMLELVLCSLVLVALVTYMLQQQAVRLPPGKRIRGALALLPVCLALDRVDPLVGALMALAIGAAFLRRALRPNLFSRSQARRVAEGVMTSKVVHGRLLSTEELETTTGQQPASAAATGWDELAVAKPPSNVKDTHISMPEMIEDVETVLHACLLDCFRSGGLYSSEEWSTVGAVECAVEGAMAFVEETLGPRWLRCFPGPEGGKGGRDAGGRGPSSGASPPAVVGTAPTAVPELSPHEQARLAQFQTVVRQSEGGARDGDGAIRALACTRVRAPAELVWSRLHAFAEWPKMVDHCVATEVYECDGGANASAGGGAAAARAVDAATAESVKAKVTLGVAFVNLTAHVHHTLDKAAGRSSWTLDERQANDVVANSGFWLVRPDPCGDANACVIYYSAHVELAEWCPGWLNTFIAEQGLTKAVGWLRREAERKHRAMRA